MKLEITSLAIGIGIGIAILTAIVILYVLPLGRGVGLDFEDATLSAKDNAQFWMFGLIKEINPQIMTLDQTFGDPGLQGGTNNPAVQVRLDKGAVFVNCREGAEGRHTPEECSKTLTQDRLAKGVHVCALVSTFGDGILYAGKIWIDRVCSHSEPVQSSLTAEGITLGAPYLVEISWDLYETIYGNNSDLSISIKDKETMEPLEQVTFDFGYKGLTELGGFQERYIEDFSNPHKFRTGIKNPCDMHLTIFIDKVGDLVDQSFANMDLDTSSVGIQFRTFPENELEKCDNNNIMLSLFNGYDLRGNRVPSEEISVDSPGATGTEELSFEDEEREHEAIALVLADSRVAKYTDGALAFHQEYTPAELTDGPNDEIIVHVVRERSVIGDWRQSYEYTTTGRYDIKVEFDGDKVVSVDVTELPDFKSTISYDDKQKEIIAMALNDPTVKQKIGDRIDIWVAGVDDQVQIPDTCPYGFCNAVVIIASNSREAFAAIVNDSTGQVVSIRTSEEWAMYEDQQQ